MALLDPSDLDSIKGGANAWLRLEMTLTGRDKAPASDRKELDAYLKQKGLQAGPWMDISLFKKVGEKETQLHETKEPLSFTVIVPASARNSKKDVVRTFYLLRVHDGKVTEVSSSADAAMTGKSREFSTYLLAYSDKKSGKKDDPDKGDIGDKKDKKDKK